MMADPNRKDLRLRYEQPRDKISILFNYEGADTVLEISSRYSINEIESLLQNIFGVNRKLVGFRDTESGIFYIPSNFVQNAIESPQARYEVFFEKERQNSFIPQQRRASPQTVNNINPFQGCSAGEILHASRNNQIPEPPNQMSFIDFNSGSVLDPNIWRQEDSRSVSSPNSYPGSSITDQRNVNPRTPTMWSNLNSMPQSNQQMNLGYLSDGRSTNNSRIPTPNRDTRFDHYYSSSRETNRLHDQQLYDDLIQLENCDSIDNEFNSRPRFMTGNPLEDSRSARDRDLSIRLQRLSDRLRSHLDRPQSPYLKKEQMINYVNSLANFGSSSGRLQNLWNHQDRYHSPYSFPQWYIQDPLISKEDADILQGLINCEDEFIMAAFDIFESDKDEENLFDTLKRLISSNF